MKYNLYKDIINKVIIQLFWLYKKITQKITIQKFVVYNFTDNGLAWNNTMSVNNPQIIYNILAF